MSFRLLANHEEQPTEEAYLALKQIGEEQIAVIKPKQRFGPHDLSGQRVELVRWVNMRLRKFVYVAQFQRDPSKRLVCDFNDFDLIEVRRDGKIVSGFSLD